MSRAVVLAVVVGVAVAAVPAVAQAERSRPDWRACGERGAECASVAVPLDWARPGGERITVAVSRVKAADPARRIGVLFVNPGGPGGPAVPLVRDYLAEVFPPDLRDRFDIVGVDPRGVGESVPAITCPKPPTDPKTTQFPRTPEQYQRLVSYNREVANACRQATGPLIDHVDTVSAARDFDAVRAALGADEVSWLGLSYGTLLGATYAKMFPNRVRAAVFDGAVDHTIGSRRMASDEARSTEDVFTRFAEWCAAEQSCALHGRDVLAEYRALQDRAERQNIPAEGAPDGVTAERIGYGVYELLYMTETWPHLAEGLRDATAAEPDAAMFVGRPSSSQAAYRVIACHDFPSDVRGFADLAARQREARRLAPVTRGHVEAWDIQAGCAGWPIRPANPWGPVLVRGAANVLVVGGEHDPATPHAWAVGLTCQIQGSRLLTSTAVGHTAYFNDPDVRRQEVAHLVDAA
ncbi:pimeloyl-ACP methyl ester carboxylesterase [Saccharothrix tamanrassetensis]|uniref:Pimeloyl-ACP methyl ester carboxylesterase n=1 Tax=Saccharothrix tamanrassetensis TaxID=1051531 RepID=A0A841CXJ7_9PSEU|nr:alpha/beta fold hydrolase [Saccharothrix tamanrassetensis]MBB5960076.1 pimeloyl-ACP methyl ester carboxylesterase [Saccharothrix tamanrassetensis]